MDLEKLLKQFKNVEPQGDFKMRSWLAVIGEPQKTSPAWREFLEVFLAHPAVAVGALMLLFLGSSAVPTKLVSPSSLDPQNIKVEAQAIDLQIQLTDLNYKEYAHPKPVMPPAKISPKPKDNGTDTESTSTPETTIDNALEQLAE